MSRTVTALLVLALTGPMWVAPLHAWHHHAPNEDAGTCAVCAAAHQSATFEAPPTPLIACGLTVACTQVHPQRHNAPPAYVAPSRGPPQFSPA